ncbi:hypothetical protein S40285_10382 [Stachybotrys chlorohalonatus IBT 40285]|uniref:Uncharacterized protein n=1 Tax=Stachybotrys chlorohalonatus (strain IBT 40285) TaxID=1283841 RepID=A0A084QER7_STAC4|nr:hypothetical protein S40285_10382 [Stachybotrys chlorohalonata IBT 40285]
MSSTETQTKAARQWSDILTRLGRIIYQCHAIDYFLGKIILLKGQFESLELVVTRLRTELDLLRMIGEDLHATGREVPTAYRELITSYDKDVKEWDDRLRKVLTALETWKNNLKSAGGAMGHPEVVAARAIYDRAKGDLSLTVDAWENSDARIPKTWVEARPMDD